MLPFLLRSLFVWLMWVCLKNRIGVHFCHFLEKRNPVLVAIHLEFSFLLKWQRMNQKR